MTYRIDRLGHLLHDASRLLRRRFAARTGEYGLSATQWRLLGLLFREGPQTQAALADRLDVEPISVSRLIDRMEQSGWVRREAHPEDRRARIILPTAQAEAIAPPVRGIVEAVADEALAALTDAERAALHRALLTIIDTLNRPEPAAAARITDETRA